MALVQQSDDRMLQLFAHPRKFHTSRKRMLVDKQSSEKTLAEE